MKIFELSTKGEFHINHNEDALAIRNLTDNKVLLAVMDGCSMGIESHFASTIIAKILRKIATEISYKEFINEQKTSLTQHLKQIANQLFSELKTLRNTLLLERNELLSTIILVVLDIKDRQAEIITIGDGLICYNQTIKEYDQDDKPDYLGYHLDTNFDEWFGKQTQVLSLNNITDLSISTDGIYSFKRYNNLKYNNITESEIINFFLINENGGNQDNMLRKKLIILEKDYGLKPTDDLSIIRIIV